MKLNRDQAGKNRVISKKIKKTWLENLSFDEEKEQLQLLTLFVILVNNFKFGIKTRYQ